VSIDARGLARYWAYLSQLDAAGQGHELLASARTHVVHAPMMWDVSSLLANKNYY
jgi:hypothetical protein